MSCSVILHGCFEDVDTECDDIGIDHEHGMFSVSCCDEFLCALIGVS